MSFKPCSTHTVIASTSARPDGRPLLAALDLLLHALRAYTASAEHTLEGLLVESHRRQRVIEFESKDRSAAGSNRSHHGGMHETIGNASTEAALRRALDHALAYTEGLASTRVHATASDAELHRRLGVRLPRTGKAPAEVVDELVAATEGGHLASAGGRFFAWVIGGTLDAAVAADWLAAVWNQNAALHACAPAAAVTEEIAGAWMKELLGLPLASSFAFTTGCQLAHVTCLAAARHSVLRARGWDVHEDGLAGALPIRVFVGERRHASVDRAARLLGLGARSVVPVRLAEDGSVDPVALDKALGDADGPSIVVLGAGDLEIGAFDRFDDLVPLAKRAGAWVHVDGAFGLVSRASRAKRHLSRGVEAADSWAMDAHKWLNVPFDSGFAVVRDVEAHRASMSVRASYITPHENGRDPIDWTPEWSRRARGFAIWAALRELGRDGVEAHVDRCCELARSLVSGIGRLAGAEPLWMPTLNQGLVRFRDPRGDATDDDHDRRTGEVIAAVNASGEAFFSGTTWRGKRAMRVSVVNRRTTEDDVTRALRAIEHALREARTPEVFS